MHHLELLSWLSKGYLALVKLGECVHRMARTLAIVIRYQ